MSQQTMTTNGYFGRTCCDVVDHYDALLKLNLGGAQKNDLAEYLRGM